MYINSYYISISYIFAKNGRLQMKELKSTAFNSIQQLWYMYIYNTLYDTMWLYVYTHNIPFIVVFNDQWIDADPENIQSKAGIPKKDHNHISISVTQFFFFLNLTVNRTRIKHYISMNHHSQSLMVQVIMTINDNQWQSMTINDNQWQSMTINDNQWQSMTINDNQWQSMTINDNQWQSMTINDNQWQSMTINDNHQ